MDILYIQIIILMLFILGIIGGKKTWGLSKNMISYLGVGIDSIEGFIFSVIVFIFIFILLSPVMGVIAIIQQITN